MTHFVEGVGRQHPVMPDNLEDYIAKESPVRVIDAFVDSLDLEELGFQHLTPAAKGRPAYHPADMLKLLIYGYLNRIQSCRRLEQETLRNIEVMWLLKLLQPDFKTINNFRRHNGSAIQRTSRQFVKFYEDGNSLP